MKKIILLAYCFSITMNGLLFAQTKLVEKVEKKGSQASSFCVKAAGI